MILYDNLKAKLLHDNYMKAALQQSYHGMLGANGTFEQTEAIYLIFLGFFATLTATL